MTAQENKQPAGTDTSKTPDRAIELYKETCSTHRVITDFRGKLLGFLPFISGAGIYLLLEKRAEFGNHLTIIGALGFLVTLGLFLHDWRGVRHCGELIEVGRLLEKGFDKHRGQFTKECQYYWKRDPKNPKKKKKRFRFVDPWFAACLVYGTTLIAWLFVAAVPFLSWP